MKKIVLIVILLGFSGLMNAQNLEKYEDMDGVDGVFITQHLFELLSKIDLDSQDAEEQAYVNLIKNLTGIKVLSTTDKSIGTEMESDAESYINSGNFEELMRVKKDGKSLKFYSKPGSTDEKVSELFMTMTQDEQPEDRYIILSITGDIDLEQIGKVAGDLKGVPGAEELQNIKAK